MRELLLRSSCLFALSGCASWGSHLSATPLRPGGSEVSYNVDGVILDRGVGPQPLPNPEFGWRRGVSRDFDVGGRINAGSLVVDGRFRWLDTRLLDLALVPGVGAGFVPVTNNDTGLCNANLLASLLGGLHLGEGVDVVLGPRGISTYAFPFTTFSGDASGARFVHYVGGMIGARLAVGERTFLSPELNVFAPYDTERHEWYLPTVQGGLGIQVESKRPR